MRQKLEQVLYEVTRVQERERGYRVIDLYYLSASVLYSDRLYEGSFGNLYSEYDLGEITGDKSLSGWTLQERFDFSNIEKPHLNYEIYNKTKGIHLKNILGDSHKIDLDF